ncbi:unnamed protein product [Pleuronectes platessa]|uniref:Uncharacterized protein n=1 Tax=Pleuronectes platessa TaxID=8262 RepID=A0A9N7TIC9_PLEPL|nr:unnamed protein product [Pleuronectes platessa]
MRTEIKDECVIQKKKELTREQAAPLQSRDLSLRKPGLRETWTDRVEGEKKQQQQQHRGSETVKEISHRRESETNKKSHLDLVSFPYPHARSPCADRCPAGPVRRAVQNAGKSTAPPIGRGLVRSPPYTGAPSSSRSLSSRPRAISLAHTSRSHLNRAKVTDPDAQLCHALNSTEYENSSKKKPHSARPFYLQKLR